ncbi:MAG: hypothetical protein GY714_04085 [Desulfobacterales bacterium]|nr:hypothetical protein [Desulfobacterales bacterium]
MMGKENFKVKYVLFGIWKKSLFEKVGRKWRKSWEKMEAKLGEIGGKVGRKWRQSWEKKLVF